MIETLRFFYKNFFYYKKKSVHLIQRRDIPSPVKHPRWGCFAKTINGFKLLNIFAQSFHLRYLTGFWICFRKYIWSKESFYKKDQRFFRSLFLVFTDVLYKAPPSSADKPTKQDLRKVIYGKSWIWIAKAYICTFNCFSRHAIFSFHFKPPVSFEMIHYRFSMPDFPSD